MPHGAWNKKTLGELPLPGWKTRDALPLTGRNTLTTEARTWVSCFRLRWKQKTRARCVTWLKVSHRHMMVVLRRSNGNSRRLSWPQCAGTTTSPTSSAAPS